MFVVGLTGNVGSGKTTISNFFANLGVKIIDADISARSIVKPGQVALSEIEKTFGKEVIKADGGLNRRELRNIMFADKNKCLQLEKIMHPAIRQNMLAQLDACDDLYAILVLPLLDIKQWKMINQILVVDADKQIQRQRVMQRDNVSLEHVNQMLDAQASRIEHLNTTADILLNNNSLEYLQKQVTHYHSVYSLMAIKRTDAVPS